MALPELPDDRRAPPRRYPPADRPSSVSNGGVASVPPGGRAEEEAADGVGQVGNGHGPNGTGPHPLNGAVGDAGWVSANGVHQSTGTGYPAVAQRNGAEHPAGLQPQGGGARSLPGPTHALTPPPQRDGRADTRRPDARPDGASRTGAWMPGSPQRVEPDRPGTQDTQGAVPAGETAVQRTGQHRPASPTPTRPGSTRTQPPTAGAPVPPPPPPAVRPGGTAAFLAGPPDPGDPDATVVIGAPIPGRPAEPEAVTQPTPTAPAPHAAELTEPKAVPVRAAEPPAATGKAEPATVADDAPDIDEPGERPSRRERREAGDTTGAVPAAEYRAKAEAGAKRKRRAGRRRRPAFWRELPMLVVVALLLTFLIQTFVAKVYVIPSGSMETTLHGCTGCNNDRVLVDKITYRFSDPQPGDVVVFRGPDSWSSEVEVEPPSNAFVAGLQQLGSLIGIAPPDEKDFVKRVIAVGGQTVQCCDSRNRVLVDGQPLDEPYVYYLPSAGPPRQEPFGPVVVPQGQLWMMGDSRNNSSDSRVPDHGPVPVENVIGKARVIVLPVDRFSWIESVNPQSTAVGMAPPGAAAPLALGLVLAVPLLGRRRRPDGMDAFLPDRRRWP